MRSLVVMVTIRLFHHVPKEPETAQHVSLFDSFAVACQYKSNGVQYTGFETLAYIWSTKISGEGLRRLSAFADDVVQTVVVFGVEQMVHQSSRPVWRPPPPDVTQVESASFVGQGATSHWQDTRLLNSLFAWIHLTAWNMVYRPVGVHYT